MSRKPPEKPEDRSVEWPDGSWLTWNEETETWDKQASPSKSSWSRTDESKKSTAPATSEQSATKVTTTKSGKSTKAASGKAALRTPVKTSDAVEEESEAVATVSSATAPTAGWRPQAERGSPVVPVERSTQIRLDRRSPVPQRARPIPAEGEPWPVSAIATGIAVGVVAGYLLTFLVP